MTQQQLTEEQQIAKQWQEFSKTLAYQKLIEYIELQKETYNILASGPIEVYKDVETSDGKYGLQFEFEPEKYAYLLQRGVGCDIVKMYVEGYVENTTPKRAET